MTTNLELTGEIIKVLPVLTGTSAKGEWKKQEFIVKYGDKYPKEVCLAVWGDVIPENADSLVGQAVEASIDAESRENNGRYYTDLKAWKFKIL